MYYHGKDKHQNYIFIEIQKISGYNLSFRI